jgi:tyrosine-protein kinase Etk/Wzc
MQDPNTYSEVEKNKSELWNLSFRDLFYKYIRFLPLFILSVAFALFGSYLYLRYKVPVYSAAGTMIIKGGEQQSSGSNDKFDQLFSGSKTQNLQNEIEILRSKPLMQRVVEKLDLQISYSAVGKIKTVNIYKYGPFIMEPLEIKDSSRGFLYKVKFINNEEFKIDGDPTTHRLGQAFKNKFGTFVFRKNIGTPASNPYHVDWMPAVSAAGGYAASIQVMPKSAGTGILNVFMLTPNPHLGADIINKLMQEYSQYSVEQRQQSSDQILSFINDRMRDIGKKLDSVQQLYLGYQTRYQIIDAERQLSTYLGNIGDADKVIIEQTAKLNLSNWLDQYLSDKKNEFAKVVVPSSFGIDDPTLNELIGGYNKAQIERKQLIDGNAPVANPLVKELDGQIEKLRVSIRENLKNIQSVTSRELGENRRRSNINQSQVSAMPEKIKELAEIKRQVDLYTGLYKLFSDKKEETNIQKVSATPNSDIIDMAYANTAPVKPKKKTIRMLAIFLGILVPAIFIFVSEILNDKVTTRFDVEKLTKAPILGEIGHSYSEDTLVVSKNTRSMVAEQFRIIRSNLQYILQGKEKATILVTSSFSGEGKSYVSTNIGAALSLAGKKVIVLEFDIRKPKILSGLGMPKGQGMTNFFVGKVNNLHDLVKPVADYENLFVLGCGPVPPNPSELLLDPKVDELFVWLKNNYDIIIIDTAPVGMVSDAMTLAKYADASLYLVRQGHTFKKQIALIDEFHKTDKLPKVSIIINDVKQKAGYGYYGYGRYGYGYGYGYGSYYEEEVPPGNFFDKVMDKLDVRKLFGHKKKKKKHS